MTTDFVAPNAMVLTDDLLARFDERAGTYDDENRFFDEDFAELRACGFLDVTIPTDLGGGGVGLDGYSQLLRRLAYHAPATALAVNMHVYWTGVAADLARAGDHSCDVILERAAAGEVLGALHGERGNDMPPGNPGRAPSPARRSTDPRKSGRGSVSSADTAGRQRQRFETPPAASVPAWTRDELLLHGPP
jgi:hypothetical protein